MNKSLALAAALLLSGSLAAAPAKKPSAKTAPAPVAQEAGAASLQPAAAEQQAQQTDHVVALVNSEPVTNYEVQARLARLQPPAGAQQPPRSELLRQVMEQLILQRVQLQAAAEQGSRSTMRRWRRPKTTSRARTA